MKKSKVFINGGGSLIQDNTSTRSLIYYLAMIWLAKKQGMKVMIYANGIGPLNKERNRKLTKKVVDRVDVITLRENLSYNELKNLEINKPEIMITADPALTLEPESDAHINQLFLKEGIDPHQQFIGISVRKWVDHEKYETVIADNIISKMKHKSCVIRKKPSVSEMLGIIAKTQMLIGMRLHALIFAASLKIPIVGMVYEPKVEGFMQYIDQVSAGKINSLEPESLKRLIDEVWNNRDSIKDNLDKNIAFLKDKSFENARIAMDLIDGTAQ
jgi:polysaccharide pyruvyl transferase WcaK-like protein